MDSDADRERGTYMRHANLYCRWPSTKMKSIELMVLDNFCCNLWNLLRSDSAISYFSTVHPLYHDGDLRLSLLCRC